VVVLATTDLGTLV